MQSGQGAVQKAVQGGRQQQGRNGMYSLLACPRDCESQSGSGWQISVDRQEGC